MKVGFHVINMLIWFMKERVSSQYGAILLGLLALLNFFFNHLFQRRKKPQIVPFGLSCSLFTFEFQNPLSK